MDHISFLLGVYPHTRALHDTPLTLGDGTPIVPSTFQDLGGARPAMARMLREIPGLDFDICELPLVNYLSAKEYGARFTAIPVILTRRFQHGGVWGDARQAVHRPNDLEGRRVGIPYHGHTDITWVRGILSDRYGVDLSSIEWVTNDPEQVPAAPLPDNVVQIPGASFQVMVERGELAGALLPHNQSFDKPEVRPLIPDPANAERVWYYETGVFPQLHTVVVKDTVLDEHADLAQCLYDALSRAKRDAHIHGASEPTAVARTSGFLLSPADRAERPYLGDDPLPYGLAANRTGLEMMVRFAREQRITSTAPAVEELFVPVDEAANREGML